VNPAAHARIRLHVFARCQNETNLRDTTPAHRGLSISITNVAYVLAEERGPPHQHPRPWVSRAAIDAASLDHLHRSSDSTGQTTQPNGSNGQSLVALMVAGFPDNHSGSVMTAEDRPPTNEPVVPENTDSRNPCQRKTLDTDCGCLSAIDKAERQGFEPWVPLRVLRFSRPVRSAALPSLRGGCY
jgi:hypothetical protein